MQLGQPPNISSPTPQYSPSAFSNASMSPQNSPVMLQHQTSASHIQSTQNFEQIRQQQQQQMLIQQQQLLQRQQQQMQMQQVGS
ncbi:unnamed protein product [[Candida] boidinii]|nr:unnamed protein product [[Candida] boidinii]